MLSTSSTSPGLRGRVVRIEGPPPATETGEAILNPLYPQAHAQSGESVVSARPEDRTPSNSDSIDRSRTASSSSLLKASSNTERSFLRPRVAPRGAGPDYPRLPRRI